MIYLAVYEINMKQNRFIIIHSGITVFRHSDTFGSYNTRLMTDNRNHQ